MIAWQHSPFLKPLPPEGLYFYRHSFGTFTSPPHPTRTFAYGASWFAMDNDKGQSPSCHIVAEIDKDRIVYITECHHAWLSLEESLKWQTKIHDGFHRSTVEATPHPRKQDIHGVRVWYCTQDQYQNGVSEMSFELERAAKKVGQPTRLPLTQLPNPFDLHSSARVLQSEIVAKRILIPQSGPWVTEFVEEMCEWPAVRTSARVKAMSVLAACLPSMSPPSRSVEQNFGRGSQWSA